MERLQCISWKMGFFGVWEGWIGECDPIFQQWRSPQTMEIRVRLCSEKLLRHMLAVFFFFNIPCEVTLLCKEYFYFKNRTQKLFLPFLHLPDVSQPLSFLITHLFVQLSTSHLTTYFYNLVFAWELRGDKCHVSFYLLYLPGWCLIKKSCSMYIWAEMYRLFPRSFLS